jgi:hypothetical protein
MLRRRNRALGWVETWAVGVIVATLGLGFVVGPSVTGGHIPGDLGDSRSSATSWHFFRWATGLDASFWSAPFFYPFPLTIAFGDNFLGDGFVYAIFRSRVHHVR